MSRTAILLFSIWTSILSAVFYHFYNYTNFGVPWIMFICMAVYFGMNLLPKDSPALLLSSYCGLAWGQFDFLLISLFTTYLKFSLELSSFLAIVFGTTITMYLHLVILNKTPLRHMPIIFAGVCLTFSQGGQNTIGLIFTFLIGILLVTLCSLGQQFFMKQFPLDAA